MKKKLIALAVAGAMTAPMAAMAEVQISGGLQAQLVSIGGDDGAGDLKGLHLSNGGMGGSVDGGSWGAINFVASEDLGNGMKALVKYGINVVADSNAGAPNTPGSRNFNTREAYVGMAGGFGAVLAGRLNHPYKTSTVSWDPFLATFMQARDNAGMGLNLHGSEVSNAMAYAGKFGGVRVVAALVVDEGADANDANKTAANHAMSFSVNAPVGPVELAFAHVDGSEFSNIRNLGMSGLAGLVGNSPKTLTATKVGAKYAAGDLSVAGQYEMIAVNSGAVGEADTDIAQMYVTATYTMGANAISASYGVTDYDVAGAEDSTYMAVGVKHSMSKKATVHAGFRSTDWGGPAAEETAMGVGLRVSF